MLFLVDLVTPFDGKGRLDVARLRAHVLWLAAQGVDGFVPTGAAGEFPYLTDREREAIHRTVLDAARGLPVYPTVWDTSPETLAYLCEAARENGASGVLVPPHLFYRMDAGLLADWYRTVAEVSGLPVLAYHAPRRFPTGIAEDLYAALRDEGTLAGMMDASEDGWRLKRLARADAGAVFASGHRVLPEVHGMPLLAGCVSALANAWPSLCLRIFRGETQLGPALLERGVRVEAAGGFRGLKAILGMACRPPFPAVDEALISALPPSEMP